MRDVCQTDVGREVSAIAVAVLIDAVCAHDVFVWCCLDAASLYCLLEQALNGFTLVSLRELVTV